MCGSNKLGRCLARWPVWLWWGPLAGLAPAAAWARVALGAAAVLGGLAGLGWLCPEAKRMPRLIALPVYLVAGNLAVLHAWVRALRGELAPVWEPTRRSAEAAR